MPGPTTSRSGLPQAVMIIDDEASTRSLVKLVLESEGIPVVQASTADEGLRKLEAEPTRLVLLDIRMPGMTPRDFIQHVHSNPLLKRVRIAFLTVVDFPQKVRAELLRLPQVVAYIQKPFVLAEFVTDVKRLMRQ